MQLFVTRSAQHVCCETSEDKNQKLQATTGWPQCGTLAIEVPTGSRQKCIHKGTIHCFFFDCEAGENKSIVQAFAEANLSIGHHAFGSICLVELDNQEHIQHCNFLDLCDDKAADKDDRDFGTKLSWKKALCSLGLATANPTCGSEAAVAQELQAGRLLLVQLDRDSVRVRVLRSTGV